MGRYVFKRAAQALIALIILSTIVFILTRISGNPVDLLLPADATAEDRANLTHQLGLDRPYYIQFFEFIAHTVKGDLGVSIRFQRPAIDLVLERMPNTIELVAASFLIALVFSIPLGVSAGSKRGSAIDSISSFVAVVGMSAPSFWVAIILMQIFSVRLGWLPVARKVGPTSLLLPAVSLSLFVLAGMTRLLRSSMIEALDTEFVKLARIKGVSESKVIWKHCFKNSLIPLLSFSGTYIGLMIGGAIVVETIFAWPGAARLAYEGIIYRDYPLVQAVVLTNGLFILVINFIVDIIYSYVDPRIRRD